MKKHYIKPYVREEWINIVTYICEVSKLREEDLSGQDDDDEPAGTKKMTDWYSELGY